MTTKEKVDWPCSSGLPTTMAEVSQRIRDDLSLPLALRREMVSSLNTLAKAAGKMLEGIPASPPVIRDLIRHKTGAMVGISRGRWSNVRSHAGLALLHLGVINIPNRIDAPPSEAWRALLVRLVGKGPAAVLGRFARCCTRLNIEPCQVNGEFMAKHRHDLIHRSLIADPETNFRETVLAWNNAVSSVPGWPATPLTVPDNSLYYTPPWSTYPPSLLTDVERWLAGGTESDIFVRLSRRRALSPATVESNRVHLRLMLGALVNSGEDPARLVDLQAVITPEQIHKACTYHLKRARGEPSYVNARIASLAVAIAKHHLKMSGPDLARLQDIAKALQMPKRGITDRNKARLRAMDDAGRTDAMINLPWAMAAEVERDVKRTGTRNCAQALKYQTALAIALSLTKCWRIKNLGGLTLGKHVLLRPDGRVIIAIHETEVKNRVPIETELSPRLATMLKAYLQLHRPLLSDFPSDFIFPGSKPGRPKTLGALSHNIKTEIRDRVGIDATTHFFRHFSAKLILDDDPTAIYVVKEHLGHETLETTLGSYVDRQGVAATAHYDALIEAHLTGKAAKRKATVRPSPQTRSRKGRR